MIAAAVSPYRASRNDVRNMIGKERFIEVHVDTPLEICEQRDTKGMYARARRGEIKGFTGIDDPYEPPVSPEIVLETISTSPEANARRILDLLLQRGVVRGSVEVGGALSAIGGHGHELKAPDENRHSGCGALGSEPDPEPEQQP